MQNELCAKTEHPVLSVFASNELVLCYVNIFFQANMYANISNNLDIIIVHVLCVIREVTKCQLIFTNMDITRFAPEFFNCSSLYTRLLVYCRQDSSAHHGTSIITCTSKSKYRKCHNRLA